MPCLLQRIGAAAKQRRHSLSWIRIRLFAAYWLASSASVWSTDWRVSCISWVRKEACARPTGGKFQPQHCVKYLPAVSRTHILCVVTPGTAENAQNRVGDPPWSINAWFILEDFLRWVRREWPPYAIPALFVENGFSIPIWPSISSLKSSAQSLNSSASQPSSSSSSDDQQILDKRTGSIGYGRSVTAKYL